MRFVNWFRAPILSIAVAAAAPALLSAACCCGTTSCAAESTPATAEATPAKPYPLNTCLVSDDAFDSEPGETVTKVYDGREIKFCCKDCVPKYEKDPAKYNAKLDAAAKQPAGKAPEGQAKAPDATAKPADKDEHAAHHE